VAGLESLLTRLIEREVPFVVVGGYAAVAHGSTVLTEDVDICMPLDREHIERLLGAIGDLHPVHRMPPSRPRFDRDALASQWKNLYLDTDWGQLDCRGEIAGVGNYGEAVRQSEELFVGDRAFRLLTLDALIRAKETMDRPKDRETVAQLRAIQERRSHGE
jgi:hypothetical protein